jgi:hypothetical protein
MITKFNDFSLDLLLESAINESMLYFSPDMREFLADIDSPIARALEKIEGENVKHDVTFIDIDGAPGYITFNTMSNVLKKIVPDYIDTLTGLDKKHMTILDRVWKLDTENEDPSIGVYRAKSRNSLKIGRFINRLFPGVYKDKEVEEFVNKYKANLEYASERFIIVEGADIGKWYHKDTYKKESGHLGSSCMNRSPSSYFEIYMENPKQCRMLVLIEKDELIGRAIIWKIEHIKSLRTTDTTPEFEYFLDRQYTFSDSDVIKFKNYADEQGWAYKRERTHSAPLGVMFGGESYELEMKVKLDDGDFSEYPYLDTFKYLQGETLSNENQGSGEKVLNHTDGTWADSGRWSEYAEEYIDEDSAVYSDYLEDWIDGDDCIRIGLGSREDEYLPSDHDALRYDDIREEYVIEDDAVYSDYYDHYIYIEDMADCVTEIEADFTLVSDILSSEDSDVSYIDQDKSWFKFLNEQDNNWEDNYYMLKSLLVKEGHSGSSIPAKLAVSVYKTLDDEEMINLDLTEIDAYLLDVKIDMYESTRTDIISYNEELESEGLLVKIIAKTRELENQLSIPFDRRLTTTKQTEDLEAKVKERAKTVTYLTQ